MPTISVFYGIVIAMFYNDHEPPHFHAGAQVLLPLERIEPLA